MTMGNFKWCPNCNETKDRSAFHTNQYSVDGYQHHCRACQDVKAKLFFIEIKTTAGWIREYPRRTFMAKQQAETYRAAQYGTLGKPTRVQEKAL
jgi:hypothetical protein